MFSGVHTGKRLSSHIEEVMEDTENLISVLCIRIRGWDEDKENFTDYYLKIDHTAAEYINFVDSQLEFISYIWDDRIEGHVWYSDGSWSELYYDGDYNYWEYRKKPVIPDGCK